VGLDCSHGWSLTCSMARFVVKENRKIDRQVLIATGFFGAQAPAISSLGNKRSECETLKLCAEMIVQNLYV